MLPLPASADATEFIKASADATPSPMRYWLGLKTAQGANNHSAMPAAT